MNDQTENQIMAQKQIESIVAAAMTKIKEKLDTKPDINPNAKPEHMTHLDGKTLVTKTHPIISFRGAVDSMEAEIILAQATIKSKGLLPLVKELEEVRGFVHNLIRCEITGEKAKIETLCGMSDDEIHNASHHPGQYFGVKHFVPSIDQGEICGSLNKLRTTARTLELTGYEAFYNEVSNALTRPDIIHVLNRLSSLFHMLMCKVLSGAYSQSLVEIEASGRHVHLSKEDLVRLFGKDYQLTNVRSLSQPGQYVCKERVTVEGPKGKISGVVILGPVRNETQVEISMTDARTLGIDPVLRQSGHIDDTPGCVLKSDYGEIRLEKGVIVAGRHIHVSQEDAHELNLKDGEMISVKVDGERGLIFDQVLVRVSHKFATFVHIDYDEANACGLKKGEMGKLMLNQQK